MEWYYWEYVVFDVIVYVLVQEVEYWIYYYGLVIVLVIEYVFWYVCVLCEVEIQVQLCVVEVWQFDVEQWQDCVLVECCVCYECVDCEMDV